MKRYIHCHYTCFRCGYTANELLSVPDNFNQDRDSLVSVCLDCFRQEVIGGDGRYHYWRLQENLVVFEGAR